MPYTKHKSTYGRFAVKRGNLVMGTYSLEQDATTKLNALEKNRLKG